MGVPRKIDSNPLEEVFPLKSMGMISSSWGLMRSWQPRGLKIVLEEVLRIVSSH